MKSKTNYEILFTAEERREKQERNALGADFFVKNHNQKLKTTVLYSDVTHDFSASDFPLRTSASSAVKWCYQP